MPAANNPRIQQLIKKPVHLIAFGFGAGLAPKAPGTFGTLVAVPLYMLLQPLGIKVYLAVTLLFVVLGVWLCGKTARDLGVHDHSGIVWDEIVGYLITMIAVPMSWLNILLGFALFRFFDAVKPWPVCWLDRNVKGGLGIMVDDVAAGLLSLCFLYLLNAYLNI